MNRLDFIEGREEITADYAPGETVTVHQHDGSALRLKKIATEYDATDRVKVMNYLHGHAARSEVNTGLLYIDPNAEDLHEHINTVDTQLNQLGAKDLL